MPVVIDLLSSPVKSPPGARHDSPQHSDLTSKVAKDIFHFSSDGFDFTGLSGDLDLPISPPTKRRRLSCEESEIASTSGPRKSHVYILSDDVDLPAPKVPVAGINKRALSRHSVGGLLSDPIGFSSSAPEARTTIKDSPSILDLSDDLPEDILGFSLSQPTLINNDRSHLAERTANVLANLRNKSNPAMSKGGSHKTAGKPVAKSRSAVSGTQLAFLEDDIWSSSPMKQATKPTKVSSAAKETKAVERAVMKATKEREKEEEKERKRLSKAQKAKEKQEAADIAEVNRSRTDKKMSVTEMTISISRSLQGKSVGNQVLEYMKHLGVVTSFLDDEVDLIQDPQIGSCFGLVKWRRRVKARYNEDAGHWEPLAVTKLENEKHILLHLTALEFATLASLRNGTIHEDSVVSEEAMIKNIDAHVIKLRRLHGDCKPIYLVEGLEAFMRRNKIAKNRVYTAAVLSQLPTDDPTALPASSQARRRKKKTTSSTTDYSFLDNDLVESLLLHLQINHSVLIHHTTSPSDTASWIRNFTEHISTIPYRQERMSLNDAGAAFCMDVGQVKTGDNPLDTYVKMLQEVQRVTPAMAYGIANLYPNVGELVKAFREEGPLVLEDVKKGANRDGAVTNSRLGQAVSKRLYKVFTGRNEWSTDGIA